jgi:hypothetical protein
MKTADLFDLNGKMRLILFGFENFLKMTNIIYKNDINHVLIFTPKL